MGVIPWLDQAAWKIDTLSRERLPLYHYSCCLCVPALGIMQRNAWNKRLPGMAQQTGFMLPAAAMLPGRRYNLLLHFFAPLPACVLAYAGCYGFGAAVLLLVTRLWTWHLGRGDAWPFTITATRWQNAAFSHFYRGRQAALLLIAGHVDAAWFP